MLGLEARIGEKNGRMEVFTPFGAKAFCARTRGASQPLGLELNRKWLGDLVAQLISWGWQREGDN